jgi:hypothetical protein
MAAAVLGAGIGLSAADPIELFDGKSLEGWSGYLTDPEVKTEDVWSVQDGILVCTGKPLGYLYTKDTFTNFRLVVEWRWAPGKKPGNSGVLLRITGDHKFLPTCAEAQLQSGSAGDIWGFSGFACKGNPARTREVKGSKQLGDFGGVRRIRSNENKPGEWNRYEITFDGDILSLIVNGEQVNVASGMDVVAGQIGLQSEGAEIHFRKVELTPLP